MITFTKLGSYGRLGNQLFQYAYLRSMALQLGVPFWCPEWDGDAIFDLGDGAIRAAEKPGSLGPVYDPAPQAGYVAGALDVKDGMEIQGYFQSERLFMGREAVRGWYRFKDSVVDEVSSKFDMGLMKRAVSFSLRLDDDYKKTREFFPAYPRKYYQSGIEAFGDVENLIIFADRIDLAKAYFRHDEFKCRVTYVEGLNAIQQLYLMTRCELGNVITNSTFAWWGAYLNLNPGAKIVCPAEWVRPGVPVPVDSILPDDWVKIKSLRPVMDHFQVWRLTHPIETAQRILRKFS